MNKSNTPKNESGSEPTTPGRIAAIVVALGSEPPAPNHLAIAVVTLISFLATVALMHVLDINEEMNRHQQACKVPYTHSKR